MDTIVSRGGKSTLLVAPLRVFAAVWLPNQVILDHAQLFALRIIWIKIVNQLLYIAISLASAGFLHGLRPHRLMMVRWTSAWR